jgi:23S rRNA (cytosine1962-C5)-methyltransferase
VRSWAMRPAEIVIRATATDPVLRGHPWIWKGAIVSAGAAARGDEVLVVTQEGRRVARGIYDPGSPLAVRIWSRGDAPVDASLVRARVLRAISLRQSLFADGKTTAYRVVHGEGDRMPGLVIDRYAHVAILRADGLAAETVARRFADTLAEALFATGIRSLVLRTGARGEDVRLESLAGESPPDTLQVLEHGVPFEVDLAKGQKTGAFLDQRENRRRVFSMASGKDVLNLFSYAGGFSLLAALGGARAVTSVDIALGAHKTAEASFRAAGMDPGEHTFVAADAFAFLERARERETKWDLIVSDPPSFAPNERALHRALSSYRTLHRACANVLRPGGIFCASSCSSHVDAPTFATTLDDVALGRSDLSLIEMTGAPADHPTLAAWPEGRYLKFAILG